MDAGRLMNLEAKLREIVQYNERVKVARKELLSLRMVWRFLIRGPLKKELPLMTLKYMLSPGWRVDMLMNEGNPRAKRWILESLPTERRDDPVYKALTSGFADESLATLVQSEMRLSKGEIKSLLTLAQRKIQAHSAGQVTGSTTSLILATGALILQVVPRELFVFLGIPSYYTTWRALASIGLIFVIFVLSVSFARPLNASRKVVAKYEAADWLLAYMDVITADDVASPPEGGPSDIRPKLDEE